MEKDVVVMLILSPGKLLEELFRSALDGDNLAKDLWMADK